MKVFPRSPQGHPKEGSLNAQGWNTVGNKLALGIGLLLSLFVLSVVVSLTQTQIVKGRLKDVVEVAEPSSAAAQTMEISLERTAIEVFEFLNDHNRIRLTRIDNHRQSFASARDEYLSLEENADRTKLIENMDRDHTRFDELSDQLIAIESERSARMVDLKAVLDKMNNLTAYTFREGGESQIGPPQMFEAENIPNTLKIELSAYKIQGLLFNLLEDGEVRHQVQLEVEKEKLRSYIEDYRSLGRYPREQVWISDIESLHEQSIKTTEDVLALYHLQAAREAELFGVLNQLSVTLNQEIQVLSRQRLNEDTTSVQNTLNRANQVIIILLLVGLIAGTLGGILVTRRITRPIRRLVLANQMLARGDLSERVEIDSKDEFGTLSRSFNEMVAERQRAVSELRHEIFEHQRVEEALQRKTEELQRSNTELEQFAYVASHDLQEPLRSIVGFSGLLIRRYRGQMDEDADRLMDRIVNATSRMQGLISDLLTFSRVGKSVRELTPVNCDELIQEEIGNLQAAISEKGAIVTHHPLPLVRGDHGLLGQVFRNLLGNAIKFSGGEVPSVHISSELGDDEWIISVRDNGIGIDPEYQQRIFTIFQRLHTRDEYPGTGIGLSVCQKAISQMGGRIWVESIAGQGSTFRFTLPATEDFVELVPSVPRAIDS